MRMLPRQSPEPLDGLLVVGPSAVVEDAHPGALPDRVPDVLGDLQVGQRAAVDALLGGLAEVHVSKDMDLYRMMSRRQAQNHVSMISGGCIQCPNP